MRLVHQKTLRKSHSAGFKPTRGQALTTRTGMPFIYIDISILLKLISHSVLSYFEL